MVQLGSGVVERVPSRPAVLYADLRKQPCGHVAGLSAGGVERVPVRPGFDLVEQCRARTLRVAHLAVANKLVLCRH